MARSDRVLVIGDTHCPCMLSEYPQFLRRVYKQHKCKRVVHIGDLVDLHCISYHEHDPELSIASELDKAIEQVAVLTEMFPKVELLMGNHDALVLRKATTSGLSSRMIKPFNELFELPDSWKVYPRYHKLMINDVLYMHGDQGKGGMYSAMKNAKEEFGSVVQGHLHSQSGVWHTANENNLVFGMQVGCGLDRTHMQMAYGTKFSSKPIISCGVVYDSVTAYVETMVL
jgi:predicted phosphodiesterase